jgi:mycothiol synthase
MSGSARSVPDWVVALASRAEAADGAPPFSDQALVDYRLGRRELVEIDRDAAALTTLPEAPEGRTAEFVVDPESRRRGIGTRMLEQLLADDVRMFWAHGDHPGARRLASTHGLAATRELLHLVGPVSITPSSAATTRPETHTFEVGRDEDEWVALNAVIFADHPEQGKVTRADLDQLESENWFSADNFLTLRRDDRMIGYCWLKIENGRGEFYVVGVAPDQQGEHLGALLFDAGLARLAALGIRDAHLYVEADNEPALALYRSRGFTQDAIDILYSKSP